MSQDKELQLIPVAVSGESRTGNATPLIHMPLSDQQRDEMRREVQARRKERKLRQ